VNLKLKEDRKKGYFGQAEGGFGAYQPVNDVPQNWDRYTGKGNVHFFKNKWQVSAIGMSNNVNETGFSIDDYINFMGGMQNLMSGNGTISLDSEDGLPIDFGEMDGFLNTNALGFNANFKPNESGNYSLAIFLNSFDKTIDRTIDRTTFFSDSSMLSEEVLQQNSQLQNGRGNFQFKQTIDSVHFLTGKAHFQLNQSRYFVENNRTNFTQDDQLRSQFLADISDQKWRLEGQTELDYRLRFKQAGRYLGIGGNFGQSQQENTTDLDLINQYFGADPLQISILQRQLEIAHQRNIQGNLLYSSPIDNKHLLQGQYLFKHQRHARDRRVLDQLENGEYFPNDYFSGDNELSNQHHQVEFQHKYISKKFKTALGFTLEMLHMESAELFEQPRQFQYVLPFFRMNWEVNRNSHWRMDYLTQAQAPSLTFLQPLPINTNPSEIILGNQQLLPEYRHELALEFNYFREFNFTHFMIRGGAQRILHKINYMQSIDANLNRILTPQNTDFEHQLSSYISFGTNLNPLRSKFSIRHSASLSQGQIQLNEIQNTYISTYSKSSFTIENQKKKILNLKAGGSWTWSKNAYSENNALNGTFNTWAYWGDLTFKHKDKWVINLHASHEFYPDFSSNQSLILFNSSIARNLLLSKKLQVYFSVKDLLNQNNGINQSYFMNEYQAEEIATLARYFMFGVKYSFKKLGGK
jgi:hypothetical protein